MMPRRMKKVLALISKTYGLLLLTLLVLLGIETNSSIALWITEIVRMVVEAIRTRWKTPQSFSLE